MNQWANTVLTDKGRTLMAKLTQGNTLYITKAETGSGLVTPDLLTEQTKVTKPKQTLIFRSVSYPEVGKCALPVRLTNDGLTAGYEATQIGIYATDPDEGEILFLISQAADAESGTIVPSETEMPGYSAEWTFYLQYGQADSVNVTVDLAGNVSRNEMEQYVDNGLAGKAPVQFVMTLSLNNETGVYSINKTFAELQAAYEAGSHIRLVNTNGMEFALLAFGANYMAYFAHQLDSTRYLVGFKANGTVTCFTDEPFTKNNPPYAAQVGAKGSNNVVRNSGSIKDWALAQTTSFSVGATTRVTDLPETGHNWFVDLIVTSNGMWRKLVATKTHFNGTVPKTYECTCMDGTWSEWTVPGTGVFVTPEYGYGGAAVVIGDGQLMDDDSLTDVLEAFFSNMGTGETVMIEWKGFPAMSTRNWFGILSRSSESNGSLVAHGAHSYGTLLTKTKYNSEWQPLEWVNPPMAVGVEYRTTERFYGSPVYCQLIDCGEFAAGKTITCVDISTNVFIVRFEGYVGSDGEHDYAMQTQAVTVGTFDDYAKLQIKIKEDAESRPDTTMMVSVYYAKGPHVV